MTFQVLARALCSIAVAFCLGCKSPAATTVAVAPEASHKPPPLAVESFQAAWEIIRDTHFDTNFNGVDWMAARTNFLPRIEKARSQEEVRNTIQEMLDLLDVSHLMIMPGTPQRRFLEPETNNPAATQDASSAPITPA